MEQTSLLILFICCCSYVNQGEADPVAEPVADPQIEFTLSDVKIVDYRPEVEKKKVIDGGWSEWKLYSLCNPVSCTETLVRRCNNPRPEPGGATCVGDGMKQSVCSDSSLCNDTGPVTNGGKNKTKHDHTKGVKWSRWGPCSVSCGTGITTRTMCLEKDQCETEEQPCIKQPCYDDRYGEWSGWSECTKTGDKTDTGYIAEADEECSQTRSRDCLQNKKDCTVDVETMPCQDCQQGLSKCQKMALKLDVSCLPSGEFAPEHCIQDVCYCVKKDGSKIRDSEILRTATRHISCEELRKKSGSSHSLSTLLPTLSAMYSVSTAMMTMEQTTEAPTSLYQTTLSMEPLFTFSSSGPDELNYVHYGERSPWSPCSVVCGGGFKTASKTCPVPGGACGGPDVSQIWGECNTNPCIPVSIDVLEYSWEGNGAVAAVTCRASGLPQPFVLFRDEYGKTVQDVGSEDNVTLDYVEVKVKVRPDSATILTCVATGEGQERQTITIATEPAQIDLFTSTRPVLYLGEESILKCAGTGLPRPALQIRRDYQELEGQQSVLVAQQSDEYELEVTVRPTQNTQYTCNIPQTRIQKELTVTVIDPCLGVECGEHASCVSENYSGSVTTSCQCDTCDTDTSPVCGSDCVTYPSNCEMFRAGCLAGNSLKVVHSGNCSDMPQVEITSSTCPTHRLYKGEEVTLSCHVTTGHSVTWYKDGSQVSRGDRLTLSHLSRTDSGKYTCVASNCRSTAQASCSVIVEDVEQEQCMHYGAGHFHQFNGANFNFPGVCHYVLAMDCVYGSFYIYTGTTECGSAEVPLAYTSSVTVFVERDAVVLLRGFDVNEFGVMKHLHPGETLHYQNFRIWRDKEMMHLTHRDTHFTLTWDGMTAVILTLAKSYAGQVCGLCGDVGVSHPNAVENVHSHATQYQVDRYNTCNVADFPENPCKTESEYQAAHQLCVQHLYSNAFTLCHEKVSVKEYTDACRYDVCGVKWHKSLHTGLCNVLSAYSHSCELHGVSTQGWRDQTPCSFNTLQRVAYLERRRRRRRSFT